MPLNGIIRHLMRRRSSIPALGTFETCQPALERLREARPRAAASLARLVAELDAIAASTG